MAKLPRSHEVTQAIQSLVREIKLSTKATNQLAAKRLARGDYAAAQSLIEKAKTTAQFGDEAKSLLNKWKSLRSPGQKGGKAKGKETPLWEFYRPILQALAALGGIASRNDIESKIEETIRGNLKDGDLALNAQGVPRWKIMVRRARKHMIKEGFITGEIPFKWKITSKGDQAAKTAPKT